MKEKLLVISDAAEYLGVSIDTVRRWDRAGLLHAIRSSGKTRYFRLTELIAVKNHPPAAKAVGNRQQMSPRRIGTLVVRVVFFILTLLTILFLLVPNETAKLLTTVFNTLR
jgi:excisionase family DNA binding protein